MLSRVPGVPLRHAELDRAATTAVVTQVGEQVRRRHALPARGLPTADSWPVRPAAIACARSSLPPHLVAQVDRYLTAAPPERPAVPVNADLNEVHAFVEGDRLTGTVDWGDTLAADPYLELIQVYRGLCDRELFAVLLAGAQWPADGDFVPLAMAGTLRRQALMHAQHLSRGDVFEPIAARYDLAGIVTLDDLAELLFGGVSRSRGR